jgi:hypothetical protein
MLGRLPAKVAERVSGETQFDAPFTSFKWQPPRVSEAWQ